MRIVIDTNIIVSAFLSPSGAPARVVAQFEQEAFDLLVSQPILDEYLRALGYPKVRARHGMDDAELAEVVNNLRSLSVVVVPDDALDIVAEDSADNKFFECAVAGGATYIVSGDAHLLDVGEYRGIRVLTASMFLELQEWDLDR